jgi:hypothetical protein
MMLEKTESCPEIARNVGGTPTAATGTVAPKKSLMIEARPLLRRWHAVCLRVCLPVNTTLEMADNETRP